MVVERAVGRLDVAAVVPALDEEAAIAAVVVGLRTRGVGRIVVVDNGSADQTAAVARDVGATVVHEPRRGYGRACMAGLAVLARRAPDVVVFADGDGADDLDDLPLLLGPIAKDEADLVVGSRLARRSSAAVLPLHARWGSWIAAHLLRTCVRAPFTDLGPFRALRFDRLEPLRLREERFGWTVEMQARAALAGLRLAEVPVGYRPRLGRSKVSGTLAGSVRAGMDILRTIGVVVLEARRAGAREAARAAVGHHPGR